MADRTLSLRLSPAALAKLDEMGCGRSESLRALVKQVADGETPVGARPRERIQVSTRIDAELVSQAREAAARGMPSLDLAEAIEALLLE